MRNPLKSRTRKARIALAGGAVGDVAGAAATASESPSKKANSEDDIDELRNQLSDMQKRLESLAKKTETP